MSRVYSFRVNSDEEQLIKAAAELEARPGDRSKEGSFLRTAALERARRVLAARSNGAGGSGEEH
jgi:uncharacterized protein (DUF1778 family)